MNNFSVERLSIILATTPINFPSPYQLGGYAA